VIVPIAVEPSGPLGGERDVAAITYAANPHKKGLDRVLRAWSTARREGEELVVAGADARIDAAGVRVVGHLHPHEYRALLRRARVFVCAPRREDYGLGQLEALADGCVLVTNAAPGPYAALPLARRLDARLVVGADGAGLATALRRALDTPASGYAERAAEALAPFRRASVDALVRDELLARLLA
jgi:glycosyltransferase involved in cell wall biosynthesis